MPDNPVDSYQEALWAPISWWCMGAVAVVAVWWCFFVATPAAWAWTAAAVAVVAVAGGLLRYSRTMITTDSAGLRAGRAVLPPAHIGSVAVLGGDEVRHLLGVGADARAYLLVRAYCAGAVKVAVHDERDPTPYWVISSRHPDELARQLRRLTGTGGAALGTQHT